SSPPAVTRPTSASFRSSSPTPAEAATRRPAGAPWTASGSPATPSSPTSRRCAAFWRRARLGPEVEEVDHHAADRARLVEDHGDVGGAGDDEELRLRLAHEIAGDVAAQKLEELDGVAEVEDVGVGDDELDRHLQGANLGLGPGPGVVDGLHLLDELIERV